jgi:hypothetical protein
MLQRPNQFRERVGADANLLAEDGSRRGRWGEADHVATVLGPGQGEGAHSSVLPARRERSRAAAEPKAERSRSRCSTAFTPAHPRGRPLGRTLRSWRAQILAYFDTHGVSNGGTEAINLIIEKVRRLAHGFKDFDHYRLRILLAADGSRRYRNIQNHL